MLTRRIKLKSFKKKFSEKNVSKNLKLIIKDKTEIIQSLSANYINNYKIRKIKSLVGKDDIRLIGMGGSILGSQAIYNFLINRIKKNFSFIDSLNYKPKKNKNKFTNIIISKSGNTLETITNVNIFVKKFEKKIFITEKKSSYLRELAYKLKSEIVDHNNFIGGRYSVLSEVGMVPAQLMGLKSENFKQFNYLIKKKNFLNSLVSNVASTLYFIKKKKFNSVIINYDNQSDSLFKWYQQLIAESLGKKGKGILPIISNMPKDNHSVMQLYLDGFQNNFFTFFYVDPKNSEKIKKDKLLQSHNFLRNKKISDIIYAQKKATENVFNKKNIPFRSFEIKKRDEQALGELFCFFILETILLGRMLNINPYDQPAVELIKKETKRLLI